MATCLFRNNNRAARGCVGDVGSRPDPPHHLRNPTMSFYRCNGCDNMCTAELEESPDASKIFCPLTGKQNSGFREVDPLREDPCCGCIDHCPAHGCARKQYFEESIRNGFTPRDDEEE